MLKVSSATEVRTVEAVYLKGFTNLFFSKHKGKKGSGELFGIVKVVPLKSKPGFYSLRSMGPDGTGRIEHVPAHATLTVVDNESAIRVLTITVEDAYNAWH